MVQNTLEINGSSVCLIKKRAAYACPIGYRTFSRQLSYEGRGFLGHPFNDGITLTSRHHVGSFPFFHVAFALVATGHMHYYEEAARYVLLAL